VAFAGADDERAINPIPPPPAKARRSIEQWADDFLARHPQMTKPKPPKTGMVSAIGKSLALGAIVPLVGLVAAPFRTGTSAATGAGSGLGDTDGYCTGG
jgi:hypothetical protein